MGTVIIKAVEAVGIGGGDYIVHQIQRGVAASQNLIGGAAQNIGKILSGAAQAQNLTVVSGIHTVADETAVIEHGQHIADNVQLLTAGLATGHVQLETESLEGFILISEPGKLTAELFFACSSI